MLTLQLPWTPVHPDPWFAAQPAEPGPDASEACGDALHLIDTIGPDDVAWWEEATRHAGEGAVEPRTDLDWLGVEAEELGQVRDALGAYPLAAGAARNLARSLEFHRHTSVADYLADPQTYATADALARVRLPIAPRRSPLAAELVAVASWYLNLETPVGMLLAWSILGTAAEAEDFDSADADEYLMSEAAFRAAAVAAMCEPI